MNGNLWSDVIVLSFQNLWAGLVNFVPNLVVAIIIVLVGWVIGALFGRVVAQVFRSLKVDTALRKAGVEEALQHGGINLDSGAFIGALVKWFFIVVFLVAAFDVLGLVQVNQFLQEVVLTYLPRVIVAALILVVAGVVGDVMKGIVTASAKAARFAYAGLIGSITKWAIWIFAILAALEQLNIAPAFVDTIFTGIILAVSLAVGLSFGLGGQEAAARLIEKVRTEVAHRE